MTQRKSPLPLPGALVPPGWRPDRDRRPVAGDGGIVLRPFRPGDGDLLVAGFERLSPESRYRRFLAPMPRLSPSLLAFLTEVDGLDHCAWAALAEEDGEMVGVGVARFVRLADREAADVAVTVIDAYQGRGIGARLLDALVLEALEHGITRFEGLLLAENLPARRMLARAGARFERDGGAVLRFTLDLAARARELEGSRGPRSA
jgi:RimJ/RimL family protein N-acetyltransferase